MPKGYYQRIPRLLYGFYRYTQRHQGYPFSKQAFLGYLDGNLRRGFAANQYLRQRNRQSRELSGKRWRMILYSKSGCIKPPPALAHATARARTTERSATNSST